MLGPLLLPWTWPFFCRTTRAKANLILINGWSGKKIPSYGDSKKQSQEEKKRKEKEERRGEERRGEERRGEKRTGEEEKRPEEERSGEERRDMTREEEIGLTFRGRRSIW